MVTGLVTHTNVTEIGRFAPTKMARAAAIIICDGRGIKAINRPIKKARVTEFRFKCQRLAPCSKLPNTFTEGCERMR